MVTDTDLTLKNAVDVVNAKQGLIKADEVRQVTVKAIVDTGAWTIVMNDDPR
jgi:predicted aspartyl protease